ncbi:MAG: hypothetical protein JSU66_02600, partial [Deltaproteobacteria bacterium]
MSEWLPLLFLFVFATHMPFFAWQYHRTGQRRHAATALTFALLAVTYALRIFAPGLSLAGVPLYVYVRVPAWLSALVSVGWFALHHAARLRRPARSEPGRTPFSDSGKPSRPTGRT